MSTINQRFWVLLFLLLPLWSSAKDYSIVDFGAKSGGIILNSTSIQNAINQAHQDGGGRVIIPKGTFLCGSIVTKSNVEIHLEKGAILLGSKVLSDYYAISPNKWPALIMADSAHHFSISGKGTIDGQGRALAMHVDSLFYAGILDSSLYQFKERRPLAHTRPQILQFANCSKIAITGITIKNSASWVQYYDICTDVLIDKIRVESVAYWNNDGIDIIDCKNVRITNSFINASDDGICIKSYQRAGNVVAFCDSIYVGNCTVRSSASAVKLGTSSFGGFKNVVIENIHVFDTYRSAIALECWETGTLENILIQNITAKNTGNAFFIRLSKRELFKDYPMGKLENVVIRNMKVDIPFTQPDYEYDMRGPALPFFHNIFPASITGIPNHYVKNLTLENIQITYPGRGNMAYAHAPLSRLDEIPEKIAEYPEFSMFGELPAWGLYVRHADSLRLKNVTFKIKEDDYRAALVFDDVKNLSLDNVVLKGRQENKQMYFRDVNFIE